MQTSPENLPDMSLSELLLASLNNSEDFVLLVSPGFRLLFANLAFQTAARQLHGITLQEGDDSRPYLFIDTAGEWTEISNLMHSGKPYKADRLADFGSEKLWLEYLITPVFDASQKLLCISIEIKNIQQRKTQEFRLLQSEKRFRKMIEYAASPILALDIQGRMIMLNPEAEVVFGYGFEELYNTFIEQVIPDFFQEIVLNMEVQPDSVSKPVYLGKQQPLVARHKDGTTIYLTGSLNSFTIEGDLYFLVILQDITIRLEQENRIRTQFEQLKSIAWQHSHEFRRPVANILGLLDVLPEPVKQDELIHFIATEARMLDEIVHRIVEQTSKLTQTQ